MGRYDTTLFAASAVAIVLSKGLLNSATAQVPTYSTFELQARSNFSANGPSFNLPGDTFFGNATPAINDNAFVAFRCDVVAGSTGQSLWFGGGGNGALVYDTPADGLVSDPTVNNANLVIAEQFFTSPDGIIFYDDSDSSSGLYTDRPIGASSWSSPDVNNLGNVGYRAGFSGSGNAYYIWNGISAVFIVGDANADALSPYSFLFTPSFNDNNKIAGKVRLGGASQTGNERPDQIRLFSSNGSSILIAEDRDSNPASPYTAFDNSVGLADNDLVAFTANLFAGGRGVFVSDGSTTTTIATTSTPDVTNIEFFSPAVNTDGLVAFRAFDGSGLRAVFVGDGATLRKVVREHDTLPSDLGTARIDQHDASPVFGGSIRINSSGDIAFHCGLTPPRNNQIEWGGAIYVAYADQPPPPCPADIAPEGGDGQVTIADVTAVLTAFGLPCDDCDEDISPPPDGDNQVTIADINAVITAYGPCP